MAPIIIFSQKHIAGGALLLSTSNSIFKYFSALAEVPGLQLRLTCERVSSDSNYHPDKQTHGDGTLF